LSEIEFHPYIDGLIKYVFAKPTTPMWELSTAEVRKTRNEVITKLMGPGEEVARVTDLRVPVQEGEINLRLYYPADEPDLPIFMWFHGGGWVVGSPDTHDSPCRALANRCRACVASVDYRLAPEHKFPVAVYDCLAGTRWVAENAVSLGLDADRITLGGDSAGGGLVFAVALLARDQGGPALQKLVSVYPSVDIASFERESFKKYWDKVILSGPVCDYYRKEYLNGPEDADDPLASPLFAEDLSGLPPTLIITAEHDVLTSEGEAMAEALTEAGVDTKYTCYPGMIHLFYGMGELTEEENGLAETGRWYRGEPG
jgi:acetyl esterase